MVRSGSAPKGTKRIARNVTRTVASCTRNGAAHGIGGGMRTMEENQALLRSKGDEFIALVDDFSKPVNLIKSRAHDCVYLSTREKERFLRNAFNFNTKLMRNLAETNPRLVNQLLHDFQLALDELTLTLITGVPAAE
ncbi:MAG: hypothetical protein ACRCV9_13095 [Burkholderiaceae bacterium]